LVEIMITIIRNQHAMAMRQTVAVPQVYWCFLQKLPYSKYFRRKRNT
jgi:hypothetical protein